ncbi:MAG: flagellar basal body L-ring protein FlgH [Deltaproteobacteria bacterium]|nr:flagellar basal body L-ring protein FlgH [Deltaproteobacteria bacterium]
MPRKVLFLVMVMSLVLIAACGSKPQMPSLSANVDAALRTPPVQLYPEIIPKTEGSLFNDESKANLFSDFRARNVGDIVTINIVENNKAANNAQSTLNKDNSLQGNITGLLGLENMNPALLSHIASGIFQTNFTPSSGVNATFKSKFTGQGKTSADDNMTAKISARVIQILPNGDLVIRGSREITVNYEKQYMIIQGVIRPQDITPDNTIPSTYVADAKIDYLGEGDVSNQQRKGWLSRALDYIWPF